MFEMTQLELVLMLATVALAGLIRGFSGFGSGMLMAPIFAVMFGPVATVSTVIILDMAATVQLMPSTRKYTQWRYVGLMGLAAAACMPLGLWALVSISPETLTRAMGMIVLGFVFILAFGWRYHGNKNYWVSAGVGAVSGTMMAATSLGNPVVMLYLLSSRDTPAINRSNITAYFAITLTLMLGLLLFTGLLSWLVFWRAILLTPVFMLFTWLGSRLFDQANESVYRMVSLACLLFAGIVGIVS